jgi:hypothetical protein
VCPAVDVDDSAGDEACFLTSEEGHQGSDFLRLTYTGNRYLRARYSQQLFRRTLAPWSVAPPSAIRSLKLPSEQRDGATHMMISYAV